MIKSLLVIFTSLFITMQAFAEEKAAETTQAKSEVEETQLDTISLSEKLTKITPHKIKLYGFNAVKNHKGYITIIEFNDLDCKKCVEKSKQVYSTINKEDKEYIRTIYKHIHHEANNFVHKVEIYAMLANKHSVFWEFKEKLAENTYQTEEDYINLLISLGITKDQINSSLKSYYDDFYRNIDVDHKYAVSIESHSAPMFFVDGYRLDEDITLQELNEYIKLKKQEYLDQKNKEENKYNMGRF